MIGLIAPILLPCLSTLAGLPAAFAAGGPLCDPNGPGTGSDSCQVAPSPGPADPDDEPRYATQAVIDCPVPAVGPWGGLVGECAATTVGDVSYRASRDADSER